MAAKLSRLTHKIVLQLYLVADQSNHGYYDTTFLYYETGV